MTREDLIAIIYNDNSSISCPEYSCDTSEEEASFSKCCMTCAERQLAEYKDKIRADEREKVTMSDYDCLLTCEHIEVIFKSAYDKGRADAIEELGKVLCDELDKGYMFMNKHQILHFVKQLKTERLGV